MSAVRQESFERWEPSPYDASAQRALINKGYSAADTIWVFVESISCRANTLHSTLPIRVAIQRADEGYVAENARLDICAYGESQAEALAEFRSQLFGLYEHYIALNDDEVLGAGIDLRELFRSYFRLERVEAA